MMYILKTERNAQGKLVFSKEKQGKKTVYLAKDENGNVSVVDSEWVWEHEYDIINLGVSGSTFYPVKLSKHCFKCEACGKILSVDDKHSIHAKGTNDDIDICPHCYEFGCRVGLEDYSVCEGCGEDADKCWVKDSDCFDTVEYDEISHNLRYSYVCSDIKEDFYAKCDSCGYYYFYENRNDCPKCHSDED